MELYGLDCVDLVVSYTIQFLFIAKKCKFSKNHQSRPCSFQQIWTNSLLRYERAAFVKRKGMLESKSRLGKRRADTLLVKTFCDVALCGHTPSVKHTSQTFSLWDIFVVKHS